MKKITTINTVIMALSKTDIGIDIDDCLLATYTKNGLFESEKSVIQEFANRVLPGSVWSVDAVVTNIRNIKTSDHQLVIKIQKEESKIEVCKSVFS